MESNKPSLQQTQGGSDLSIYTPDDLAAVQHELNNRYDNALAESVNALYKTELIRGPDQGPWRTVEDVELATLGWVHWWNQERLHGYLDDIPPAELEDTYHANKTDQLTVGIQ